MEGALQRMSRRVVLCATVLFCLDDHLQIEVILRSQPVHFNIYSLWKVLFYLNSQYMLSWLAFLFTLCSVKSLLLSFNWAECQLIAWIIAWFNLAINLAKY